MNFKTDQKRYRVYFEDGFSGRGDDAWHYMEIRGRRGMIHPFNENKLICLINSSIIARRIKRTKRWPLFRDTDDGMEFLIDNQELSRFAEIIKAKKRKTLSNATIEKLKMMGQKHRFKKRSTGQRYRSERQMGG